MILCIEPVCHHQIKYAGVLEHNLYIRLNHEEQSVRRDKIIGVAVQHLVLLVT